MLFVGSERFRVQGHSIVIHRTENTLVSHFVRTTSTPPVVVNGDGSQVRTRIRECLAIKTFYQSWQYDCETSSYDRLKSIQGDIVPKIYGTVRRHGGSEQAIAMEFLNGEDLTEAIIDCSRLRHLRRALNYCYESLAKLGVCQSDPKTEHVMAVELHGWTYLRWLPQTTLLLSSRNIVVTRSPSRFIGCYLAPLIVFTIAAHYSCAFNRMLALPYIIGVSLLEFYRIMLIDSVCWLHGANMAIAANHMQSCRN